MSGFENFGRQTGDLEREFERKGIVLGINWSDEVQVRSLAREALDHAADEAKKAASVDCHDHQLRAKVELFGLANVMFRTMEESAVQGFESHGGTAWKSFASAMFKEMGYRRSGKPD
jgi:hypothetical protein